MCGKCYFLVTYIKLALCTSSTPVRRIPATQKCGEPREAVRGGERKKSWKGEVKEQNQCQQAEREIFALGVLSLKKKKVAILSGRRLHFVIKQFQ